mgnify:CR=1 FL=1
MQAFTAYTRFGQQVQIYTFTFEGKRHYFAIKNNPCQVVLKDDSLYLVERNNEVSLFVSPKQLLTLENFHKLSYQKGQLLYAPDGITYVKTSDPVDTVRYDDGYSIEEVEFNFGDITIRKLIVTVAIIDPKVRHTGFKAGISQPAILLRYSYYFVSNTDADIGCIKVLNIGRGHAMATENEYFQHKAKSNGKGTVQTDKGTPLQFALANVIRRIQPGSRYACPEKAIAFFTTCASINISEIYSGLGIKLSKGTKFTAPMRDYRSKSNLTELVLMLKEKAANKTPVEELTF